MSKIIALANQKRRRGENYIIYKPCREFGRIGIQNIISGC